MHPVGTPKARRSDCETSWEAAGKIARATLSGTYTFVLLALEQGRKSQEDLVRIAGDKNLKASPSRIRTSVKELSEVHLVTWDQNYGKTIYGRRCRFWKLTDKGELAVRWIRQYQDRSVTVGEMLAITEEGV